MESFFLPLWIRRSTPRTNRQRQDRSKEDATEGDKLKLSG